ncbi:MAG TPA: hypothetical protein VFE78_32435, partial [Gemmataceae bacterium]|nr:hypothetical protein [Gemmataceae bacterium]
ASMYHGAGDARAAPRLVEAPPGPGPEAAARLALTRVRKQRTAFTPDVPFDRARLQEALAGALAEPELERERLFGLGWLRWLEGEAVAAAPLFAEALRQARAANAAESVAEAAYWSARVGVLLGRAEAVGEFEAVLRTLGGSPQATAWFVDLLWRAGRPDRAEQVWKSVRGNRRVMACDEGPLLEARSLLRRGETAPAERLLQEANPANGVVWVERHLLLAWAQAGMKQPERALASLRQAAQGPYPAAALRTWLELVGQRTRGTVAPPEGAGAAPALRDYLRGQQARREGQDGPAAEAYRAALGSPAAQPFARYGLVCLGLDDAAALLAAQPGLFLAVRCRARLALERFGRREINPAECLDALQQAVTAGYRGAALDHFRRLAQALQQRQPALDELRALGAGGGDEDAARRRNFYRAALEQAVRRLAPGAALDLLLAWSQAGGMAEEEALRPALGRQLLRLPLLLERGPRADVALAAVEALLPGEPLAALARAALQPAAELPATVDVPAARLWRAAQGLSAGPTDAERWRDEVRELRSQPRLRPLAQALLLYEAAARGDADAVAGLLEEADAWRGFHAGPPCFVVRAVESAVAAQPNHPGWRRGLARWLQLWSPDALGPAGAALAAHAGLAQLRADTAEAPPGAPAVPWLLHQAARALGRDDARGALAFVRRALALDPELAAVPDRADSVRAALPELERQAREQRLASLLSEEGAPATPGVLADAADLLGDVPQDRAALAALAERPDLSPRLAHHLALIETRAAAALEEREQPEAAEACWRRAWGCWLRFLTAPEEGAGEARGLLLDWLLIRHRRQINDLLARNAVDRARRLWALVQDQPTRAAALDEALGTDLAERVGRFREELATEYLLTTREAMRYGDVPEGWRADYEKGLGYLRRLLSLDRDNLRLLTALVEVCGEWFLDLYNAEDGPRLREQVERFTPFALQLARLVEGRPGDVAARSVLADFYKFRGFVADDRGRKAALYREALRFNPSNGNVLDLLADLGEPTEAPHE